MGEGALPLCLKYSDLAGMWYYSQGHMEAWRPEGLAGGTRRNAPGPRLLFNRARNLICHGPVHRGASGTAITTDEDDQDGNFFFKHLRGWLLRRLGARSSSLDTDLTRNTRAPHFTPQYWLLCHMELYYFEFARSLCCRSLDPLGGEGTCLTTTPPRQNRPSVKTAGNSAQSNSL